MRNLVRGARCAVAVGVMLLFSAPGRLLAQDDEVGIAVGTTPPATTIEDLNGVAVDLSRWVGKKPVLLEFWATWCPICAELLPKMKAVHAQYGDRVDFVVVAVAVNESRASVKRHLESHDLPFTFLWDTNGNAVLPIWVGIYEANAIALEIEKVQTPRPMTHDLLRNVLLGLNVRVHKVVVNELREDTFYALIWVERDGQVMSIDSRPSDALALALRVDCPIFVEEEVLKNSKVSSAVSEKSSSEELRKWLENLNDEDLGRYKM